MDLIDWVILIVAVVVAIGGLFMAHAGGGVYGLGLALFVVAVVFAFWFVKRFFDRMDAGRH
jgi:membrane protein implicated in regulation of membrane protease activity